MIASETNAQFQLFLDSSQTRRKAARQIDVSKEGAIFACRKRDKIPPLLISKGYQPGERNKKVPATNR